MRYSTSDLSRKSGDIIAHALRSPVVIAQRGKPRLIMMSIEEFNQLRGKSATNKKPPGGNLRPDGSKIDPDATVQENE